MGVQAPNTGLNMLVSQGWNSGPDTRGSLDILWTCLSTLALCVWTAIHPNIPLSYTFWPTFLERVGLMVIAIMFPEVILTSAWGQEIRAENLLVEVNRLLGHSGRGLEENLTWDQRMDMPEVAQQTSAFLPIQLDRASISHSSISTPVHRPRHNPTASPWSVGQAMFAVMGGFAIETEYIDLMDAKRTIRRLVTPEGVAVLVKTGHLPFIDREDVAERSKADVFAKGVVVIQIIWFALQVLGRLLQGLSVTPLETHTAIHVGCTVFVYASWANKPYNVLRSMLITGPEMQYIGAFFNFSDLSGVVYNKQCEKYEVERMEYWKDRIIQASRGVSAFDMLLFTGSIGLHEVIAI